MSKPSNYRWAVLFASFFAFVAFAFVFQSMPPLLNYVKAEFGVNDAEFGLLMTIVMVPGIFLALPVGLVINKYGFRLLGFLSTILAAVGSLAIALSPTYAIALLGRIILGVGGALITVGAPIFIPQWFSHKDIGKAMGVYSANMPVATILAFPTSDILARNFGWHHPFLVGAVVAFAAAIVFGLLVREGPLKGENKPVESALINRAVKNVEVWKASLIWMLFNTTAIAFLTFAGDLFQTFKNLPSLYANVLATVLMYAAAVFVPVFGWASDKSARRKPFMVTGAVLLALALNATAYAYGTPLILSVIVLGIAAAMVPPLVMAVVADSLTPNLAGIGFSIVTLCQNIGITISGPFTGYVIQTTGQISSTFFVISLFALAAAVIALTLQSR